MILILLHEQALLQQGVPSVNSDIPDCVIQRLPGSYQHETFFGSCDSGIDEVSLQHHIMSHQHRDHYNRVF